MQGTFLMVVGLLWPQLKFTRPASRIGRDLAIYGCVAAWTANLRGAVWGAGNSMLPMAAGGGGEAPLTALVSYALFAAVIHLLERKRGLSTGTA